METMPTPDKYGLVIFPLSTECPQGKACPLRRKGCFVSGHHLYFFKEDFERQGPDSFPFLLRNNPFNIIPIARCQHNKYEKLYLPPPIPEDGIIIEFLHQADFLRSLGDAAINLANIEINLENLDNGIMLERHRIPQLTEEFDESFENIRELGKQALKLGLLPQRTIMNPFDHIYLDEDQSVREEAIQIVHSVVYVDELAETG
jgi:hypothetical protein